MRISDWSSDVCSSDLSTGEILEGGFGEGVAQSGDMVSKYLIAQAEQFERRTGKPYLVQATANEYASYTRNFYTFVMQQGVPLFTDARHANFRTPAAHRALQLFKDIRTRDLTTQNQDYSAAVASFLNGGGGVFLVGTWMVQDFDAASRNPNSALHNGYAVFPYPQLFQRNVTFADGHNWEIGRAHV